MNRVNFEKPLKEKAVRLLHLRAGGRYSMFEAGQLYEICLALGMADSRPKRQELLWDDIVGSCLTEKEAKQKLKMLINQEPINDKDFLEQMNTAAYERQNRERYELLKNQKSVGISKVDNYETVVGGKSLKGANKLIIGEKDNE